MPQEAQFRILLALVAGGAWALLAASERSVVIPALCSASLLWSVPAPETFALVFAQVPPHDFALGWALMIMAMMLPTIGGRLLDIRARSFRSIRTRLMLCFASAYLGVWLLAGALFVGAALSLRVAAADSRLPLMLALACAAIWQVSPFKQVALNRCHVRAPLAAFAPRALVDAASAGLRLAFWCVVSCWPLMLVAMLAPAHHLPVMFLLSLWIWAERIEPAGLPRWRFRLPTRALRVGAWSLAHLAAPRGPQRKAF